MQRRRVTCLGSCGNREGTLGQVAGCNVALAEETDLLGGKRTDNRVDDTAVVEEDKVTLLPVVGVHKLGGNAGALQAVNGLAHLGQIVDDSAVSQMQATDSAGVHLQGQLASHRVAPAHGQDLDLLLLNGRQLVGSQLAALGDHAQAIRARLGTAHPDVGVGSVLDTGSARKLLVSGAQNLKHGLARGESSGAQGNIEHIASAVVVAARLAATAGNLDSQQRRGNRGGQAVQGCVNVPAVEAGVVKILLVGDDRGVESTVVGVAKLDVLEALILGDEAVANDLDLRLVRDGLQVGVQNGLLGIECLAVAVRVAGRIKALGELELLLRRDVTLVGEDEDLVLEQGVADGVKVGV